MDIESIFSAIARGSFKLPCPEARIVLAPGYHTEAFKGSGFIRVTRSGSFEYELMVNTNQFDWIQELNPHVPRDDPYQYFQIQLIDQNGIEWRGCEWVRPEIVDIFASQPGRPFAIKGRVNSLVTGDTTRFRNSSDNRECYQFIIPNVGRIPWTEWKSTVTKNQDDVEDSYSRKACYQAFDIEGISVKLEQLNDTSHLRATITSDTKGLPPFVDIKVLESLQFVTGRLINFGVQLRKGKNQNCVRIIAQQNHLETRHPMPIALTESENFKSFWEAYQALLNYLIENDSDNPFFHSFTDAINSVMEASSRTEGIRSLTLAVAIEAIIQCCAQSNQTKEEDFSKCEILALEKFVEDNLSNGKLKNRVTGAINGIKSHSWRAKDRLIKLRNEGVISPRQYKSWDDLRNPSAHGGFISISNKKNLDRILGDVYTLAHTLILREAGYTGVITDYGSLP